MPAYPPFDPDDFRDPYLSMPSIDHVIEPPCRVTKADRDLLIARARWHREMDTLQQGAYLLTYTEKERGDTPYEDLNDFDLNDSVPFKVCAVGCSMIGPGDSPLIVSKQVSWMGWHEAQQWRWGIPIYLGHLQDEIFEALPMDLAVLWPEAFFTSLPVDTDLSDASKLIQQLFELDDIYDASEAPVRAANIMLDYLHSLSHNFPPDPVPFPTHGQS